jgi:hypothetical protein
LASYASWNIQLFMIVVLIGCSSQNTPSKEDLKKMSGGELKEVVPVSGRVTVDGEAEKAVYIELYKPSGGKPVSKAKTDEKGNFCFSTHTACDGIEPGEYKVKFKWMPKMNRKGEGEDLLKGRYDDPEKSEFKLRVEKGVPQKEIQYELSTK